MAHLSNYEKNALAECVAHRRERLAAAPSRLLPGKVSETAAKVTDQASKLPGAQHATRVAGAAYGWAAGGVAKAMNRTTDVTLSSRRVVRSYTRRDHAVAELHDVRDLDLSVIDRVAHFKRLRNSYAFAAAGEGAAAGFLITGGAAAAATGTVAASGAGSAPGLGMVAATTGADTALTLGLASHVVAHTSLYYGYDPTSPREELFQMQIIGLGMATTQSAKAAAFSDLAKLAQLLAKSAPWDMLSHHVFTHVVKQFASAAGQTLTKRKLGQFVPVAGVALGAGLNFRAVDEIAESAYWAYRERFLREKLGDFLSDTEPPLGTDDVETDSDEDGEAEEPILILELVEEAERTVGG